MRLRSTGEWQRYVKISFKFCSQKNAIDIFQLPCKRVVFKCKNCAFKLFLSVYFNRVWDRRPLRSWRTKKSRRLSTAVYRQTDRTGDYTVDFNFNLFNFIIWNVSMYWDVTETCLMLLLLGILCMLFISLRLHTKSCSVYILKLNLLHLNVELYKVPLWL